MSKKRKLTKEDKKYIKRHKEWATGQLLLIENILINIENSERMIRNHSAQLKASRRQFKDEHKFLSDAQKVFIQWRRTKK